MTRPGRCPFGKQPDPSDPSRLIDCPEEQAALERMRQLRAEGKGAKAIRAALNAEGHRCRSRNKPATTAR